MARPKKAIKRQKYVKVSYTMVEYKFIEKHADIYHISRAEFVRNKSLNHRMKKPLSLEEAGYFQDLTGMANNLNQLTKAAHQGPLMKAQLIKTIEGINAALDKLLNRNKDQK